MITLPPFSTGDDLVRYIERLGDAVAELQRLAVEGVLPPLVRHEGAGGTVLSMHRQSEHRVWPAVAIDGTTLPGAMEQEDLAPIPEVWIDVVTLAGSPLIPGPTRKADGTWIPAVALLAEQGWANQSTDAISPFELYALSSGDPYVAGSPPPPPRMIEVRNAGSGAGTIGDPLAWSTLSPTHVLMAEISDGDYDLSNMLIEVTINYASGSDATGILAVVGGPGAFQHGTGQVLPAAVDAQATLIRWELVAGWCELRHRVPVLELEGGVEHVVGMQSGALYAQ